MVVVNFDVAVGTRRNKSARLGRFGSGCVPGTFPIPSAVGPVHLSALSAGAPLIIGQWFPTFPDEPVSTRPTRACCATQPA